MAGSIVDNLALYKKKTFTYVPPTPPAELLEATNFTLDLVNRKFIQIGIDPTYNFKVVLLRYNNAIALCSNYTGLVRADIGFYGPYPFVHI